jgi:holliday junction DNA helicase RuvB
MMLVMGTPQLRIVKDTPEEQSADAALRPHSFDEYTGQKLILKKLRVYVGAAKSRGEALDHCLFCGPPGLGKTSLSSLIANELGVPMQITSGPALERKADLAGILSNMQRGQVLFIDEIHRIPMIVEETLYPAMEDFKLDCIVENGRGSRTIQLPLERFTVIGATTQAGLLSQPLRDRFQIVERMEFYKPLELASIVARSARLLGVQIDQGGAYEIGRRARGTPRIANRLLRRVRDFAQYKGNAITKETAAEALELLDIDENGCDAMDREILRTICDNESPIGLESIAATVGEAVSTLEDVYEPFLMQQGLIQRTPRGRVATAKGYKFLGRKVDK